MANIQGNGNAANQTVNLKDLFFFLLRYWYWFVLSVLLCVGFAAYKYLKSDLIFRSNATIIIKNPSNNRSSARMETYSSAINKVNVANEILQFRSANTMAEVVRRLEANVSYTEHIKLRDVEIYKDAPIHVVFPEEMDGYARFTVTPVDESTVKLDITGKSAEIKLGQEVNAPFGVIKIEPARNYGQNWYGKTITVTRTDVLSSAKGYISRLRIAQANNDASILTFTLMDYSRSRAKDILNTLINVYNEAAIAEKNEVAVNTADFINERLDIIEMELGDVEGALANYKSRHQIMSVDESASQYLSLIHI